MYLYVFINLCVFIKFINYLNIFYFYMFCLLDYFAVTRTHLKLYVDFERTVLSGKAILVIERRIINCDEIVSKHFLY